MNVADEVLRQALDPPSREWRSQPGLRDAAVIAPLFTRDGEDHLLYIVRRDDLPHHAGEVSFPGGAREAEEDAAACALREMAEEIGIAPGAVTLLGRLRSRTSIAGFRVEPFVGRIAPPTGLVLDRSEVADVLEIPLRELAEPVRWEMRELVRADGRRLQVPFFPFQDRLLWGLTGRITQEMLERLPRNE